MMLLQIHISSVGIFDPASPVLEGDLERKVLFPFQLQLNKDSFFLIVTNQFKHTPLTGFFSMAKRLTIPD